MGRKLIKNGYFMQAEEDLFSIILTSDEYNESKDYFCKLKSYHNKVEVDEVLDSLHKRENSIQKLH